MSTYDEVRRALNDHERDKALQAVRSYNPDYVDAQTGQPAECDCPCCRSRRDGQRINLDASTTEATQ